MQRINEDIKNGNFKQIYLLYGEERYLKNQYTTRLRKALCQDGDEMNTHFYQGKDFSLGQVIDLAETLPFTPTGEGGLYAPTKQSPKRPEK